MLAGSPTEFTFQIATSSLTAGGNERQRMEDSRISNFRFGNSILFCAGASNSNRSTPRNVEPDRTSHQHDDLPEASSDVAS